MIALTKLLSANDTGETGSHQVGALIPKFGGFLRFFPHLDPSELNPSETLRFRDLYGGAWEFRFIYYNNRLFGGTRNEYRLTRMTGFLRRFRASPGDGLVLMRDEKGNYFADIHRGEEHVDPTPLPDRSDAPAFFKRINLVFDEDWKVFESKE